METLYVRPAPGARVRDPVTKLPIAEAGAVVPNSGYWQRRIRTGDVVVVDPPAPKKTKE